jgi:hypothetical protein
MEGGKRARAIPRKIASSRETPLNRAADHPGCRSRINTDFRFQDSLGE